jgi:hypothetical protein
MALFDCMMVPCVFMEARRTPDGSGGHTTKWEEGEPLKAAIIRDSSTEARIAEAAGTVEMYTITVSRSVHMPYHAVIKRRSDGKIFRITSDNAEQKTPLCTALDIAQSNAEAWRLPE